MQKSLARARSLYTSFKKILNAFSSAAKIFFSGNNLYMTGFGWVGEEVVLHCIVKKELFHMICQKISETWANPCFVPSL